MDERDRIIEERDREMAKEFLAKKREKKAGTENTYLLVMKDDDLSSYRGLD